MPKPEKNIVWIACRAHTACEGTQAELMASQSRKMMAGRTVLADGGNTTRYRCQTCGQIFIITT